jgi:WD40 repeat protein
VAVSRQLAADSQANLAEFPQRSLLLAAAAVKTPASDEAVDSRARMALGEALAHIQGRPLLSGGNRTGDALVSDNGEVLAVADETTGYWTWRMADETPTPREFQSGQSVSLLGLSSSGRWLVVRDKTGRARLRRLDDDTGGEVQLTPDGADIDSILISPAENWLVTNGRAKATDMDDYRAVDRSWGLREVQAYQRARGGKIGHLWDLRVDPPRRIDSPEPVLHAERRLFSSSGAWLATQDDSGIVRLWAMSGDAPVEVAQLTRTDKELRVPLAFSPDSRWLFAAGGPDQATLLFLP